MIDVHQSSFGLKKGQSYHVKQVESSGAVRLDNGAVLPLNLPETFSVHQRRPKAFELCVGDLVRLPHKTPDMPSAMDPRLTYRVIGLMGGSVFLKEAWGSTPTNGIVGRSAGDDRFSVPTTYGRFTYAYCQTPAAPMERMYDYIHSIQEGSTQGIDAVQQLRTCVLGARTHSLTFTTDVQSLRITILLASEAKTLLTRHELDTSMEAPNHRSKTPILSLVAARALKGGFDHER